MVLSISRCVGAGVSGLRIYTEIVRDTFKKCPCDLWLCWIGSCCSQLTAGSCTSGRNATCEDADIGFIGTAEVANIYEAFLAICILEEKALGAISSGGGLLRK